MRRPHGVLDVVLPSVVGDHKPAEAVASRFLRLAGNAVGAVVAVVGVDVVVPGEPGQSLCTHPPTVATGIAGSGGPGRDRRPVAWATMAGPATANTSDPTPTIAIAPGDGFRAWISGRPEA